MDRPTSTSTGTGYEARVKPQCDLVMKGGITSGIVYPPALDELQKMYSFNSIGGTSAGAIAAAAAALPSMDAGMTLTARRRAFLN